jgi:hypothetical protein
LSHSRWTRFLFSFCFNKFVNFFFPKLFVFQFILVRFGRLSKNILIYS